MVFSPLVTVVIPAFNAASFVGEAIASIQRQTLQNWELIVVDDGSSDRTRAAALEAAGDDPRIRVVSLEQNRGISSASNTGFDEARGEFIARLDADDRALETRLDVQVAAFQNDDSLAAAGSHARVFGNVAEGIAYCALGDGNIKARLLSGMNTISGGTLMVRTAFVRKHRIRFDESMASAEDLDYLSAIMVAGGQLANVDEVLTEHRSHDASFTHSQVRVGSECLQAFRRALLARWYPALESDDIALIVAAFREPYAPYTEAVLTTVRAMDRLVRAGAVDYGQDTSVVHTIVLDRLVAMAGLYRDHRLLNASHLEAMRYFVSAPVNAALDRLGL
ncbi:glycosyltransferase family 2 protein [Paraburkholderia antibiotica]|uniref:Glycosyltransferase n=1 Tax=Paraburkholderia antibiotica TaxID=2728839 RepID=A0A7X9X6R2_9BURK|nr:glycosyltransferase family 2 protein [Paraburkholderia antibiotica]NML32506.1 glycosyltransferase [Paraburkholderia antibiotica]